MNGRVVDRFRSVNVVSDSLLVANVHFSVEHAAFEWGLVWLQNQLQCGWMDFIRLMSRPCRNLLRTDLNTATYLVQTSLQPTFIYFMTGSCTYK
jgi:hypothetical protein